MTGQLMFAPLDDLEVFERARKALEEFAGAELWRRHVRVQHEIAMDRSAAADRLRESHLAAAERDAVMWQAAVAQRIHADPDTTGWIRAAAEPSS